MARTGRPSKFTPEVRARILAAIREGNYYESACRAGGVDYATFRRWLEKGAQAKSGEFYDFCEEVQGAEAEAEIAVVDIWKKAMPENWQAARDFLARRWPKRWANQEKHEVTGADDGPLTTVHVIRPTLPPEVENAIETIYGESKSGLNKT